MECLSSFRLTYDAATSAVALAGTIDPRAAGHVAAACELLARTAGERAFLDLSEVEALSPSAIEELSEGVLRARDHGVQIVITARSGTDAGRALAEARIPHLLTLGAGATGRAVAAASRRRRSSTVPSQKTAEVLRPG